jgi:preprotein translocase subunit SecE
MKKYLINLLIITAIFACIRFCVEFVFGLTPNEGLKWILVVFWFFSIFFATVDHLINR